MKKMKLSLIVPCYNEQGHLKDSYQKVVKELENHNTLFELIFIDDASTDNTRMIISDIARENKNVRYIFHDKNVGRGGSVMDGIKIAKNNIVGFIDIDLEISEKYIDKFVKKIIEGYDLAIARRKYSVNLRSLIRIFASRGYVFLEKLLLGSPFDDTEAGYKFFNRDKIIPILKEIKDKRWFWDTEIVIRSHFRDLKVEEIPVIFRRRLDKKSTVKIIPDIISYVKSLWLFKKEMEISSFPLLKLGYLYKNDVKGLVYVFLKSLFFPLKEIDQLFPKSGLILDLGCGEGVLTNFLSALSRNRKVIGIDVSSSRLKIANKTIKKRNNIQFIKADIMDYKFPNCNGIVISDFLHHLSFDKQETVIENSVKALEQNGILLIKEVDRDGGIRHALSRFWDFILYPNDKINYRRKKDWEKYLLSLGLKVRSKEASFLSPFSTVLFIATK